MFQRLLFVSFANPSSNPSLPNRGRSCRCFRQRSGREEGYSGRGIRQGATCVTLKHRKQMVKQPNSFHFFLKNRFFLYQVCILRNDFCCILLPKIFVKRNLPETIVFVQRISKADIRQTFWFHRLLKGSSKVSTARSFVGLWGVWLHLFHLNVKQGQHTILFSNLRQRWKPRSVRRLPKRHHRHARMLKISMCSPGKHGFSSCFYLSCWLFFAAVLDQNLAEPIFVSGWTAKFLHVSTRKVPGPIVWCLCHGV